MSTAIAFGLVLHPWLVQVIAATLLRQNMTPHPSQRALEGAGKAIIQLHSGEGVHVVTIAQSFFGTPGECEEGIENQAELFFAIYRDPDTSEPICGILERDLGACFQKTVAIGCNPETNTATIDLYIRDEAFKPGYQFIVDNPTIEPCRAGTSDKMRRTIIVSETFDCIPARNPATGTCSETHNECVTGTFCDYSETSGYQCKRYAPVGGVCGGFRPPGQAAQCNPNQAFCFNKDVCQIPDLTGVCVSYLGPCSSDPDCGTNAYCDKSISQCKPKLAEGDCCDQLDDKCGEGTYCNLYVDEGPRCRAYAPLGAECGSRTDQGEGARCDPQSAHCYSKNYCQFADTPGECRPTFADCTDIKLDCPPDQYCDANSQKCRERLELGVCCQNSLECLPDLDCREGADKDSSAGLRCNSILQIQEFYAEV